MTTQAFLSRRIAKTRSTAQFFAHRQSDQQDRMNNPPPLPRYADEELAGLTPSALMALLTVALILPCDGYRVGQSVLPGWLYQSRS
jgi:hypothetical protein